MYSGVGKSFKDEDISISYADFTRDNTIHVFNLNPDLNYGPYFDLVRHSSNLEAQFAQNI